MTTGRGKEESEKCRGPANGCGRIRDAEIARKRKRGGGRKGATRMHLHQ